MQYNYSGQFDRKLFDKHDGPAKVCVQHFLKQKGYILTNTDEAYASHDFIVAKDGIEYKVEVEQKAKWFTQNFPWPVHTVPYRKIKSKAVLFYQVSANSNYIAFCKMETVKNSPIIRTNTCLGTTQEPFFAVEKSDMTYYHLKDNIWYPDSEDSDIDPE